MGAWDVRAEISVRSTLTSLPRTFKECCVAILLVAVIAFMPSANAADANPVGATAVELPSGGQKDLQTTSLKKLTLEQLANLEVTTAFKAPVSIQRTPAAIYVLTEEDIRRSGATSIPELLRLVPGVEVARIDSDKWSIGIRGFGSRLSRSVLVLLDGRTVYTPLFAGVYWEVQDTLLSDIDRVEVIGGPGGTIW